MVASQQTTQLAPSATSANDLLRPARSGLNHHPIIKIHNNAGSVPKIRPVVNGVPDQCWSPVTAAAPRMEAAPSWKGDSFFTNTQRPGHIIDPFFRSVSDCGSSPLNTVCLGQMFSQLLHHRANWKDDRGIYVHMHPSSFPLLHPAITSWIFQTHTQADVQ